MAFFKNIKKTLGFTDSDNDLESIESNNKDIKSNKSNVEFIDVDDAQKMVQEQQDMTLSIFESVVDIFNSSLPAFLKETVDTNAQKKYIFDALDASIKEYISNINTQVQKRVDAKWQNERIKIDTEIKELKRKCQEIESSKEELKKQQLSADRQKRALTTRIHDLESKITSYEAEKEQYELENRSLINKLKAFSVVDKDLSEIKEENLRLRKEIETLKHDNNSSRPVNNLHTEEISSKIDALSEENDNLKKTIEQLRVKEELSDAMINELNEKASLALRQIDENNSKMQNTSLAVNEIETLREQLSIAKKTIDEQAKELTDAKNELEVIDQIQEELTKFESITKKKEQKITELQKEVQYQASRIKELEEDAESLKSTIEQNLYNQAISEDLLKNEIKELKESKSKTKKTKAKSSSVKISAIDESIIDADWLISTPPEGVVIKSTTPSNGDEFGYQAPPQKHTPESDAQMTLW